MDEGLPQGGRKGNDYCTPTGFYNPFAKTEHFTIGLDHRFRKTQKRTSALQPRLGPDNHQGHETHRRDQEEEGTCVLEEQVRWVLLF